MIERVLLVLRFASSTWIVGFQLPKRRMNKGSLIELSFVPRGGVA